MRLIRKLIRVCTSSGRRNEPDLGMVVILGFGADPKATFWSHFCMATHMMISASHYGGKGMWANEAANYFCSTYQESHEKVKTDLYNLFLKLATDLTLYIGSPPKWLTDVLIGYWGKMEYFPKACGPFQVVAFCTIAEISDSICTTSVILPSRTSTCNKPWGGRSYKQLTEIDVCAEVNITGREVPVSYKDPMFACIKYDTVWYIKALYDISIEQTTGCMLRWLCSNDIWHTE